jgi:ligand-binding SRPBCC domain-containing protein
MAPRSAQIGTRQFTLTSELPVAADVVWRHVISPHGINAELWPIRMHLGDGVEAFDPAHGQPARGILISLCGLLPIDWHWLRLESVTPGRGFHEVSSSLVMKRWVHIRTIEPRGDHCALHDQVEWTPRLAFLAALLAPIYQTVFRRRHRSLQKLFAP